MNPKYLLETWQNDLTEKVKTWEPLTPTSLLSSLKWEVGNLDCVLTKDEKIWMLKDLPRELHEVGHRGEGGLLRVLRRQCRHQDQPVAPLVHAVHRVPRRSQPPQA